MAHIERLLFQRCLITNRMDMEKCTWIENAAKLHDDNLWRHGNRTDAPQSLLPYLATQLHSLGHEGVEKVRHRFGQV